MEPYYDPATDTIHGCKPGTWAHYHELRHRHQYQQHPGLDDTLAKLHIRGYYAALISGVICGLARGPLWAIVAVGLCMLPHLAVIALMEGDAYVMGTLAWLRRKR
jgi:hypothetical protein